MRIYLTLFVLLLTGLVSAQVPPAPTTAPGALISADRFTRAERLGITFINDVNTHNGEIRYRNALLLGAQWTRWPLYWNRIEAQPGDFDWGDYDELVANDLGNGLSINAILLGRPEFAGDGNSIAGLNEPVFSDGSDQPGPDKAINPDNPWAIFVYEAVQRYKPGGMLGQMRGWPANRGINIWEVWNEPDHPPFWRGGILAYARLLKVAYLAAHHADPDTTIMFGGLLYSTEDNWLARVLAIFVNDPQAESQNYYMDAVAIHSYADPWRSGWLTLYVRETMDQYEIMRPIWLNETGVNVWDDYPGPVWATDKDERLQRATAEQQAWFLIQSAAYAWSEGADKVFFHQLYDDCGDQPPGTDFPPNRGELCVGGNPCFGDGFGIFRNESTSVCYSQHPFPGTPRPVAQAYRLLADVFSQSFSGGSVVRANDVIRISFERPQSNERIHVIWNHRLEANAAVFEASGSTAQLYTLRRRDIIQPDESGSYRIPLDPAKPDNYPSPQNGDPSAIGGPPVIVIERVEGEVSAPETAIEINTQGASGLPDATAPLPDVPILELPRATIDPADDTRPPTTQVEALPEISPPTFNVRWSGQDDSGIDRYVVWVQVNEGGWQPWIETQRTEATYTGQSGQTYRFVVWAVDLAGNWSLNTDLSPQAVTRVE